MTQNNSSFNIELLHADVDAEQSSDEIQADVISTATAISGRLRFNAPRNGSGDWMQTVFVAILFEDIVVNLIWNPLVVLLELECRTRRFSHPIPSSTTYFSVSTRLVLLDSTDTPLAPPIDILIYRDTSQPVSDTGLVQIRNQEKLDVKNADMSKVAKVKFFGTILTPIA